MIEYFLRPLLKYRPEGMEIRDWMDILFGADYRDIDTYTCHKETKINGTTITKSGVRADNFGYRTIKPGDVLYVRTDTRTPNLIDVEVLIGAGKKSRIFRLNALQWYKLKKYVKINDSN